mgnify:CR=1 FL=1
MIVKYTAKKTWNGFVSVRDFIVNKALKNKASLLIQLGEEQMLIEASKLKELSKNSMRQTFTSKFDGKKYELIDFPWHPDDPQGKLDI